MRLPFPYRPEAEVLAPLLQRLHGLDWALASIDAIGWIDQVRAGKPSAFAMETLLREFPLSSAEGLALMRLAERCCACPMPTPPWP